MKHLTLFKASAGAGKTFQLTSEYLKLMFSENSNFTNILAVTFTNKATAEMSERILKELHLLSLGSASNHADTLKNKFELNDKELQQKAKVYLNQLLHNYTRFNISTIDSFFQKILKSFTREVGLSVGFNLELNQAQVVEDSVTRLFDRFHENKPLQNWLTRYAQSNLESGKSWDVQKQLARFANEALGDVFFGMSAEELNNLANLESFQSYKKTLLNIVHNFEREVNAIGIEADRLLKLYQLLVSDFSYGKSGAAGYLVKIATISYYDIKEPPGKRLQAAAASEDNTSGWVTKKSTKIEEVSSCVGAGLKDCSIGIIALFEKSGTDFFTALVILNQLDAYAVLVEVFRELIDYCDEQNIFLLSMASPLLSSMIGEHDAPFIYEKTGDIIRHYMIDEFQDTSAVQWKNFFPLFQNGISQNYQSLVVGDIKQSIYRWRGGDWSLLDQKIKKQFSNFGVDEKNLPFNWRSDGRIIEFNNWLFSEGSKVLEQELNTITPEGVFDELGKQTLSRIYENAAQKVPQKEKGNLGHVRVRFFEKPNPRMTINEEEEDPILQNLLFSLEELNAVGYRPKDIAIIVRRNTEGARIASFLMDEMQRYPEKRESLRFVSNDSVFLESSLSIQLVISLLQYILNPKDKLSKAQVLKLFLQQKLSEADAIKQLTGFDWSEDTFFFAELPEAFLANYNEIVQLPLVDMVDRLLRIFVQESPNADQAIPDQPFIHTFLDYVLDLGVKNNYDVALFLNWWKEGGNRKPVSISEDQDAIRIITIHKSKGLEFKAVLIPYLDWELGQKSKVLWCNPKSEPFNTMDKVPVMYGSKLKQTHFSSVFYQEQLMAWVDNLNVLYVALTRAEKVLHITAPLPSKSKVMNNVGTLLYEMISNPSISSSLSSDSLYSWNENDHILTFGKLALFESEKVDDTETANESFSRINNLSNRVSIRMHSLDYYSQENPSSQVNKGLLYHRIFEKIKCIEDIDPVVRALVREGVILVEDKLPTISFIKQAIANCKVEHWFNKSIKVYNEQSICVEGKGIKRPDRVMFFENEIIVVDYKFTENKSKEHNKQIKEYMTILSEIDTLPVKGFLWYVNQNELDEIL